MSPIALHYSTNGSEDSSKIRLRSALRLRSRFFSAPFLRGRRLVSVAETSIRVAPCLPFGSQVVRMSRLEAVGFVTDILAGRTEFCRGRRKLERGKVYRPSQLLCRMKNSRFKIGFDASGSYLLKDALHCSEGLRVKFKNLDVPLRSLDVAYALVLSEMK